MRSSGFIVISLTIQMGRQMRLVVDLVAVLVAARLARLVCLAFQVLTALTV